MTDDEEKLPAADQHMLEAAQWRVRLAEQDLDSSPAFETWLLDPANAKAWRRVAWTWNFVGSQAHTPELVSVRQVALANIGKVDSRRPPKILIRRGLLAIAATMLLALGFTGGVLWLNRPQDYRTAQGERRVIALADGSKLSLDADSEVSVRYTRNARALQLLRGQARFDVEHNAARPFSVIAGEQKVVATGTAFNIDMTGQNVSVTLIEGHVVVLNEDAKSHDSDKPPLPRIVELNAGQQFTASAASPAVETVNIAHVTAWTNGKLAFDNEPLSSVVAHVNRYSASRIEIDDPQIGRLRISGVLNAGDIAGFIDVVTQYLPVQAVPKDDDVIVLEGKSKTG